MDNNEIQNQESLRQSLITTDLKPTTAYRYNCLLPKDGKFNSDIRIVYYKEYINENAYSVSLSVYYNNKEKTWDMVCRKNGLGEYTSDLGGYRTFDELVRETVNDYHNNLVSEWAVLPVKEFIQWNAIETVKGK
jgi:hypothetical protein